MNTRYIMAFLIFSFSIVYSASAQKPGKYSPLLFVSSGAHVEGELKCAQNKDPVYCYNAAYRYAIGDGAAINQTRATELYAKSCEGDVWDGCYNAGIRYSTGKGVKIDKVRATQFYVRACEGNVANGCLSAGNAYESGEFVDADFDRAARLHAKACALGNTDICFRAGLIYSQGNQVEIDGPRALKLFIKGCEADNAQSCYFVAVLYIAGKENNKFDIEKDEFRAKAYLKLSCELGQKEACDTKW